MPLCQELDRRDKIGFETPEKNWLVEIAPTIRKLIREDLQLPFLRQDKLLQEFETVIQGKKQYSWQIWRWINFGRWHSINFH